MLKVVMAVLTAVLSVPAAAPAVQWREIARTDLHKVAIDTDSTRITLSGRLGVWFRFTPLGERQRREAARELGPDAYRMHLEYYEIDCGENTAMLGLLDVVGKDGRRLSRDRGNKISDPIPPGSALDRAAALVCPDVEDAEQEGDEEAPPREEQPAQLTDELRQRIETCRQTAAATPKDPKAWVELGNAYYDAVLPAASIAAYDRVLALQPDNPDVLNDQGAMYRQSGNFKQAVFNFRKALALQPRNLESLYNLGYVYAFDLNDMRQALAVWRQYLKLDGASEDAARIRSYIDRYGKESGTDGQPGK